MNKKLAKLVKNLKPETKTLVLGLLNSPIQWDLINFYDSNPFSIHTARGLANMVGRRSEQVFEEAEKLATLGVLKKVCENGDASTIYAYEPSADSAAVIRLLLEIGEESNDLLDELNSLIKNQTTLA